MGTQSWMLECSRVGGDGGVDRGVFLHPVFVGVEKLFWRGGSSGFGHGAVVALLDGPALTSSMLAELRPGAVTENSWSPMRHQ